MNITPEKFKELIKNGYSLDILYLLQIYESIDMVEYCIDSSKLDNIHASLIRKGLVSMDKLTIEGKNLLDYLEKDQVKYEKKKAKSDDFDKWWETYPGTDTFEYNGKSFTGTRALKAKKPDCKAKLNAILGEGEYTIDELIGALKLEINQKVQNSVKSNENKMKYMQNSLTYLNQRTFEPFVDLYRKGVKPKEEVSQFKGVDI